MARPVRQSITTVTAGPWVGLDWLQSPFNVSIGVDLSNATGATYGVQYLLSDPNDSTITPLVRNDTNLAAGQTANGVSNYTFPVYAVRCNVSALTSGTVVFEVMQGMSAR